MNMKEQLISFKTAKLAMQKCFYWDSNNQKGYNEEGVLEMCDYSLHCNNEDFKETNLYSAPTQSLLQKWLREVHKLSVCISFRNVKGNKVDGINEVYYDVFIYYIMGGDAWKKIHVCEISNIYEEALEHGLKDALKLI